MGCVTTDKIFFLINVEAKGLVSPQRGLRQELPFIALSFYLVCRAFLEIN